MVNISAPKVCISVLNWNNYEQTIDCLKSLENLDYDNYHIIVADNASSDQSVEHIRRLFPAIEIIQAETNLGYAGGNELALRRALGDSDTQLFWILNNDAQVAPDALRQLVSAYQESGEALYGGVPLTHDSESSQQILHFMLWDYHGNRLYVKDYHGLTYEDCFATLQPRIVPSLHGSSLLIPLSVVRQRGFMETRFFLYSEESDYCLRLGKQGVKSVLVPASVIYHIGGGARKSRPQLNKVIEYYRMRNRLILFRRHSSLSSYAALLVHYLFTAAHKSLRAIVNRHDHRPRFLLRAIYDGMRGHMGKTLAPEDYLTNGQS